MNAVVIREAGPNEGGMFLYGGRPAIIQINGSRWTSEEPHNSGEAETANQDARRIVEKLNAQ